MSTPAWLHSQQIVNGARGLCADVDSVWAGWQRPGSGEVTAVPGRCLAQDCNQTFVKGFTMAEAFFEDGEAKMNTIHLYILTSSLKSGKALIL